MSIITSLSPGRALPQDAQVFRVIAVRATIHVIVIALYFWTIQFFTSLMDEPDLGLWSHFWLVVDDVVYWIPGLFIILPLVAFDWAHVCRRWEQTSVADLATIQNQATVPFPATMTNSTNSVHDSIPSDSAR